LEVLDLFRARGSAICAVPAVVSNAIGDVKFYSGSHDAVIRVYDDAAT
jgi:hypothetical protein